MDEFRKFAPLHTVQPPYNLFERQAEREVLPYAIAQRLSAFTYGALCRGLLSGRMSAEAAFHGDDLRRIDPKFQPPRLAQYVRAVSRLDELAQRRFNKRVIHLALRWVLDQPGVGAALWGARHPEQLDPLPEAFGFSLDDQVRAEIDRIIVTEIHDPVGPEFMAPPARVAA
jgi:aryl-alcohol dehydrogenase-like predicted oxidoreductase